MKKAKDMTREEYAAARRAATRPGEGETKREPKPVSTMSKEEYAAAKKAAGIR